MAHPKQGIFPTSGKITAKSLIGKTLQRFFAAKHIFYPKNFDKKEKTRYFAAIFSHSGPQSPGEIDILKAHHRRFVLAH